MNMGNRGQAALNSRQKTARGADGPLTYTRLAGGSVDVTGKAWLGQARERVSDSTAQTRVIWSDRAYLIAVEDLAIAGVAFKPVKGDYFTEVFPGGTQTFEVIPYADEPESRYSDLQSTLHRIHEAGGACRLR